LCRKFEEVRTAKARNIIGASTGAEVLVAESAHEVIGLIVIRLAARKRLSTPRRWQRIAGSGMCMGG